MHLDAHVLGTQRRQRQVGERQTVRPAPGIAHHGLHADCRHHVTPWIFIWLIFLSGGRNRNGAGGDSGAIGIAVISARPPWSSGGLPSWETARPWPDRKSVV